MSEPFLNAQPGFLNRPSQGGPYGRAYPGRDAPPSSTLSAATAWLTRFWREQVVRPELQAANLALAWGVGFFAAGVAFSRSGLAREMLVPAF